MGLYKGCPLDRCVVIRAPRTSLGRHFFNGLLDFPIEELDMNRLRTSVLSRTLRPALLLVLLLPLAVAVSGCGSVINARVPPKDNLRGGDLFVVPFKYGNYWHYDSREGNRLGQALEVAFSNDCGGLKVVRNKVVQRDIKEDLSDEIDWLEYARRVGVDYLIVGEIHKLSLDNPRMIAMFQGNIDATYVVWDVKKQESRIRRIQVKFPKDPDSGRVFIGFEEGKSEIESALIAQTAKQIAGYHCGYEQEGLPQ